MYLAMCLKHQEFQPDVYKIFVYKKNKFVYTTYQSRTLGRGIDGSQITFWLEFRILKKHLTDGRTDGRTDGPTDGQSLLQSRLFATKKTKKIKMDLIAETMMVQCSGSGKNKENAFTKTPCKRLRIRSKLRKNTKGVKERR